MAGVHHISSSAWLLLAIGGLNTACGGGDLVLPNNERTLAIEVVDGDGQLGRVGASLPDPVVVEVTDDRGDPVEGATVEFALTSAGDGAGVTPSSARTGASGRAQAHVQLGDKIGVQTGEARVALAGDTGPKATFSALAESEGNGSPRADFGWSCDDLTCQFTDASTDADGSVTAWAWRFGDGSTSTERQPSHTYAEPGTYTVRLEVTDDQGATDQLTDEVTVTAAATPPTNQRPRADFDVDCDDLTCTFTDRSTDGDGRIESRRWNFGDGATSGERNPSHTYASEGRYDVALTVTDDDEAEDTQTRSVEPEEPSAPPPPPPPPNEPPRAEFEVTCQDLQCAFVDRSRDSDGSVVNWAWDFGDGATSTERNPSHVYSAPGRFNVLLIVTDDDGAADAESRTAEPTAPPSPEPNKPPRADFDVRCDHLTCSFTDKSKDDDGTIVSWSWSFGDGSTSSDPSPTHTYSEKGRYEVLLTVTDDDGATDTRSKDSDPKD